MAQLDAIYAFTDCVTSLVLYHVYHTTRREEEEKLQYLIISTLLGVLFYLTISI